MVLVSW